MALVMKYLYRKKDVLCTCKIFKPVYVQFIINNKLILLNKGKLWYQKKCTSFNIFIY